jgi:hypothetical protein
MRIDSSGNVGIGTSSPTVKLDVRGTIKIYDTGSTNSNLIMRNSTTGDAAGFGLQQDGVNTILYNGSNGYMSFYTNTVERMRIDSSGNVLIGTTSPVGKLTLLARATSTVTNGLTLDNDGGGAGNGIALNFYGTGTAQPFTGRINSLDDGNFGFHTVFSNKVGGSGGAGALTERMRIDSSGVTIYGSSGTTASNANKVFIDPSASAESGRVTVVGNNGSGGALFLGARSDTQASTILIRPDGDIENANNSYGGLSDERLKQDIVDASSQWNDIKSLKIRKYRFKSDPDAPLQLGLIAQEVEQISPNLISETDDGLNYGDIEGSVKTVKYSVLYMKAVKALQEAIERIEIMEAKVNAQAARIAALESK